MKLDIESILQSPGKFVNIETVEALALRVMMLESLTYNMRKELDGIEVAIDDPRLDITHTGIELITEFKERKHNDN